MAIRASGKERDAIIALVTTVELPPTRLRPLLALLLLVLAAAATHSAALRGGFVHDDRPQIVQNPTIRSLGRSLDLLASDVWATTPEQRASRVRYWRPVFLLSYAVDFQLWALDPFGWHLTNLVLHCLAVLLAFRVFARLSLSFGAAFLGALLFAVHPVNSEPVNWLAARVQLLSACFLMGALLAYVRWRWLGLGRAWLGASAALFAFALLSWEAALAFPLLLVAAEWMVTGARGSRPAWRGPAAVFLVVLAYLAGRAIAVETPRLLPAVAAWPALPLMASEALFHYARLLVFPFPLSAVYPIPVQARVTEPAVIGGFVVAACVLVILRKAASRSAAPEPVAGERVTARPVFWLAWVLVLLAPAFNLGAFGDILLAERYLYLPSVGFCALLALGWEALAKRAHGTVARNATVVAAVAVVVFFSLASYRRASAWRSEEALYASAVQAAPLSASAHNNWGTALEHSGRLAEAEREFRRAIELKPGFEDAHVNLALVLLANGRIREALAAVDAAERIDPTWAQPHFVRGEILKAAGDLASARLAWLRAVELEPRHARTLVNLGVLCQLEGDLEGAIGYQGRAVAADAGNAEAVYNLALALDQSGRSEEAVTRYREFLSLAEDRHAQAVARARERLQALRGVVSGKER